MEVECSADSKEKEGEAKRVRRRRKKIYQTIRQQMEFYFSDANLTKDRFLSKLVEQYPYVDLNVFLKFNKIRALTNSVEELANALSKSEFLSLSEDRTKVARLTPVQRKACEDECSIYVEGLPPDAKHEWLQEVFSVYGKVEYVSIPKYRHSGKIKGFAFVEFESEEAAKTALEAFQGAGYCLPSDMAPEQLCSVTTFEPGEGKTQVGIVEEAQRDAGEEEGESSDKARNASADNVSPTVKKKKRRKRAADEDDAENEEDGEVKVESFESEKSSSPVAKKKKPKKEEEQAEEESGGAKRSEVEREESREDEECAVKEKKKRKRRRENSDEEEVTKEVVEEDGSECGEVVEAQRKRKRKKEEGEETTTTDENREGKGSEGTAEQEADGGVEMATAEEQSRQKRRKRNRAKHEKVEEEPLGLRILSKRDWKRLRNKYLQLQRKNMQMLRSQMIGKSWCNYWGGEREGRVDKWGGGGEEEPFGGPLEDKASEAKGKPRLQFVPGVIVRINFKEPQEVARKIKDEVRSLPKSDSVAYIDMKDAASVAYIRCHSADAAKELTKDIPWEDRKILEGAEEKEYWDKIVKDRAEKIDKKIRVNQRGRDKILKKAENLMGKHLHYDN